MDLMKIVMVRTLIIQICPFKLIKGKRDFAIRLTSSLCGFLRTLTCFANGKTMNEGVTKLTINLKVEYYGSTEAS